MQDIKIHRGTIELSPGTNSATTTVTLTRAAATALSEGRLLLRRQSTGCGSLAYNPGNLNGSTAGQYTSILTMSDGGGTTLTIQADVPPVAAYVNFVGWELWEYAGLAGGPNEFINRGSFAPELTNSTVAFFDAVTLPNDAGAARHKQTIPVTRGEEFTLGNNPGVFSEHLGTWNVRFNNNFFGSSTFYVARSVANASFPLTCHLDSVEFTGAAWYTNYFEIVPGFTNSSTGSFDFLYYNVDWDHTIPMTMQKRTSNSVGCNYTAAIRPGNDTAVVSFVTDTGFPTTDTKQIVVGDAASVAVSVASNDLSGWTLSSGNMHVTQLDSVDMGISIPQLPKAQRLDPQNFDTGLDTTVSGIGASDFSDLALTVGPKSLSTTASLSIGSHLLNYKLEDDSGTLRLDWQRGLPDLTSVVPQIQYVAYVARFRTDDYEMQKPNTTPASATNGVADTDLTVDFMAIGSAGAVGADTTLTVSDGSSAYEAYPAGVNDPLLPTDEGLSYQLPTTATVSVRKTFPLDQPLASEAVGVYLNFNRLDSRDLNSFRFYWQNAAGQGFASNVAVAEGRGVELSTDMPTGNLPSRVFVDLSAESGWTGSIHGLALEGQSVSGQVGPQFRLRSFEFVDSVPSGMILDLDLASLAEAVVKGFAADAIGRLVLTQDALARTAPSQGVIGRQTLVTEASGLSDSQETALASLIGTLDVEGAI